MGKNVTYEDVRDMAVENGQTVDEAIETLKKTAAADRADHVEEYDRPWSGAKT